MGTEDNVRTFIELFRDLPDTRQPWKIRHLLHEIIFICICGTLMGADDFEAIELIAKSKQNWFSQYLELPHGIPSHDTMERVFAKLDPDSFLQCFLSFVTLSTSQKGQGVIAIDGKTMRGVKTPSLRPVHIVSAWFSETGMILGQLKTEEKSNEITLIPKLLDLLAVKGHVVTIDAMGTQEAIATKIVEKSGDCVLALKENHATLLGEVKDYFCDEILREAMDKAGTSIEPSSEKSKQGIRYCHTFGKAHGRSERREYFITDDIDWMIEAKKKWKNLKSIGMVRYSRLEKGTSCTEMRYFITTLNADPTKFAYCVRNHWGIESMHWVLDTVFNEDKRRFKRVDAARNLSQVLKFVYNILMKDPTYAGKRHTKKRLRFACILDDNYLDQRIASMFS